MKKIIYLFFFIPLMINLAACYDDTGNYDYTDLPECAQNGRLINTSLARS